MIARPISGHRLALGGFILLVCLLNMVWIRLNVAPPRMYDDAVYLADSVVAYDALRERGVISFVGQCLLPTRGIHPPMMKILPIPVYLVLGPGTNAALYAYTLLIPVFCVYLFLLAGVLLEDDLAALLAVVITCLFPLTYGMWRNIMTEFGTAVAVVAALYHLLQSDGLRVRRHVVALGLFLAWGLLWKVSFPLFVAGPIAYVLIRRRPALRNLFLLAAIVAILAGPFYVRSGRWVMSFALLATGADAGQPWSLGPVFSLRTLVRYWFASVNFGISAYFFVLLAVFSVFYLFRSDRKLSPDGRWFLFAWFVPPFLFLSFQVLKEIRHLLPAYPALGMVMGALVAGVVGRRPLVLGLLGLVPMYQFAAFSFDARLLPRPDLRCGPVILSIRNLELESLQWIPTYTYPANRDRWPVEHLVETIAKTSPHGPGHRPRVRVVGELPYLSGVVLHYYGLLNRTPLITGPPQDSSDPRESDFLVVPCGPQHRYGPLDLRDPALEKSLAERRLPFEEIARVPTPAGCDAVIYRKVPVYR